MHVYRVCTYIQAKCQKNGNIIPFYSSHLSFHFLPKSDFFNSLLVVVSTLFPELIVVNHGSHGAVRTYSVLQYSEF